jgi:hypothetical protein
MSAWMKIASPSALFLAATSMAGLASRATTAAPALSR